MTAIDFRRLRGYARDRIGRGDPALFPHLARCRGQGLGRGLRSGDGRRPRRRNRDAQPDQRNFPEHGIIGEEYGNEHADAEYVWVLDPIDGTKSFIAGMPAWGSLIALTRNGNPVYGMMHQPFIGERFNRRRRGGALSRAGGQARPDGAPMRGVVGCDAVHTSPLLMTAGDRAAFGRVEKDVKLSRYGGDCYAYCMLAAGHIDLVIESGLNAFDIMALIPIVQGAGGIITSWEGGSPNQGGRIVAAGDKRVHEPR